LHVLLFILITLNSQYIFSLLTEHLNGFPHVQYYVTCYFLTKYFTEMVFHWNES